MATAKDTNTSTDRVPLRCSVCSGPFRYSEDGIDCMCSSLPPESIAERLVCHRCEGPVGFDESLDENPMNCGCPPEERPDSYYIMSHSESIDRVSEFL